MVDLTEALGVDPSIDYAPPPDPRRVQSWSRRTVGTLTVVGALLVGFLLATGLSAGHTAAQAQLDRRGELIALIEARQEQADVLSQRLEGLREEMEDAEGQLAGVGRVLRDQVSSMETAAGMTALGGPGARLTFDDGPEPCPTGRQEDCRIQDTDLQLAVNALFGLGAEAVAVNDERVIATTAVRGAGRAVLVNHRVLSAPYVVEAIGEPRSLTEGFARTEIGLDFEVWRDVYGLGYTLEEVDQLRVPAYGGSVRLRSARIAEDGLEAGRVPLQSEVEEQP